MCLGEMLVDLSTRQLYSIARLADMHQIKHTRKQEVSVQQEMQPLTKLKMFAMSRLHTWQEYWNYLHNYCSKLHQHL